MANEKVLNTRIKLKYDLYSTWAEKNPVLLEGEVALAYIPAADPNHNVTIGEGSVAGTTPPQVLIKVGDGTNHYNDLKYVSALAADVLNACKSAEGLTAFINGVITEANLATAGNLEALAGRVSKLEGDVNTDGSVAKAIKEAIDALDLANTYAAKEHKHIVSDITDFDEKVKAYDYATKTEAQGYANAKDQAIAAAQAAADDAQKAIADLDMAESKADDTTKGGVVIDSIKQEDGKVSVTRRALTEADVPVLSWAKISASEGYSLTEYLDIHDMRIGTLESNKADAEDFNQLVDDIGTVPSGYDAESDTYKWENLVEYIDYQNDAQDTAIEANANAIAALQTAQAGGLVREVVTELPAVAAAKDNTIYMIKRAAGLDGNDVYDEYIIVTVTNDDESVTKKFELLGNTELDLSNYYDKEYIDDIKLLVNDLYDGDSPAARADKAENDGDGNNIVETYETKEDASAKLDEAKGYTDALANGQVKTNKEAIEAINHAETGILAQAKADSADKAAVVLSEAQKYADGLAPNYATAAQGQKADSALQEVVANDLTDKPSGIKVTEKNKIEVDDTIIWVFDCGDSTVE